MVTGGLFFTHCSYTVSEGMTSKRGRGSVGYNSDIGVGGGRLCKLKDMRDEQTTAQSVQ